MHNLYLLVETARYLEIPLIDFCETSHNGKQAPKVCAASITSKVNNIIISLVFLP